MTNSRLALVLEYDGRNFAGFERQRGQRTVQGELERAVSQIAGHRVACVCAGRTDSGVHAVGQVVHFDTVAERPERAWVLGVNTFLPEDVAVRRATPVAEEFHARFSAERRAYRYFIYVRRARAPLLSGRATWRRAPLDVCAMQAAASALVGEHDFSAFRAAGCQAKSPVRTVHTLAVSCAATAGADAACRVVQIDVCANAFLQHMVRNIAGVLIAVGSGERAPEWAGEVLAGRDRRRGGVTAPPTGLYFLGATYPRRFGVDPPDDPQPPLLAAATTIS